MSIKSEVKTAIMDVIKENVDRINNNGLALNYKANPASQRIMYYNGVTIDGMFVYHRGKPIYKIITKYSDKTKNNSGTPKMLTPSLMAV